MVFDNSAWTLSQIRILNANMVCVRALCVFFSICFCFVWVIFFLCLSFQSKAFLLFSWCVLRFRFLCKYFMSNIHRLGFSQRQDTQMNEKTSTNFKMNTNQIINLHRRSQTNVYTQTPLKFCYYYYYYYFQFNEAGFPLKFAFFFSLSHHSEFLFQSMASLFASVSFNSVYPFYFTTSFAQRQPPLTPKAQDRSKQGSAWKHENPQEKKTNKYFALSMKIDEKNRSHRMW